MKLTYGSIPYSTIFLVPIARPIGIPISADIARETKTVSSVISVCIGSPPVNQSCRNLFATTEGGTKIRGLTDDANICQPMRKMTSEITLTVQPFRRNFFRVESLNAPRDLSIERLSVELLQKVAPDIFN